MTTTNDLDTKLRTVNDFNAEHLPGTWVRYWTGTRQDPAKYGQTRSKAELLSGHTPVVWVTTHGACIALTHVDPIPGQPDDIADDSHDLPKLAGAAERVSDYIAANGDGIYDLIDGHPLYARDLEALRRAADHVWAGEQLRDELERTRTALTESRKYAARRDHEIGRLVAESARVRQQRDELKPVVEAAKVWRGQFSKPSHLPRQAALMDAVDALCPPNRWVHQPCGLVITLPEGDKPTGGWCQTCNNDQGIDSWQAVTA